MLGKKKKKNSLERSQIPEHLCMMSVSTGEFSHMRLCEQLHIEK